MSETPRSAVRPGRPSSLRPVARVAFAPVAVLALVTLWEISAGGPSAAPAAGTGAAPAPVAATLLPDYAIAGGLDARRETVDRTLFNPTRRPAPPQAQEAAKSRMQRGQFVLTGTAVAGTTTIAFLREASSGRSRSAKPGDVVNGVTVAEVRPDRVRLTQGDESEELTIKVAAAQKPVVQAHAPAQPGAVPVPTPGVAGAPTPALTPAQVAEAPRTPAAAPNPAVEERRREFAQEVAAQRAARAANEKNIQGVAPPPPAEATDPRWAEVFRRYGRR